MEKTSIIFTSWGMDNARSDAMRKSLLSLIATTKNLPTEIIVVDNGGNRSDSRFLLALVDKSDVQHYVRNSSNLYFGYARNQGFDLSCGEYIVFSDNDIEYKDGWLEKGLKVLKAFPDKKIAFTPLRTDRIHRLSSGRHYSGELELDGEKFRLNMRAGSNSWLMRREDFPVIGRFRNHYIAGSKWTDAFVRAGYSMVVMDHEPLAIDIGFKRGYNHRQPVEIKKRFTNGEEIIINN